MSLDLAILGFLGERPRSGYDLKTRCFDRDVASLWTADQAQIYRTLDRLEREDLVVSRRRRQAGRPDRKIYELTPAGRETLDTRLAEPAALPAPRDPFALNLYFSAGLSDDTLLSVLSSRRESHQRRLDSLREQAARSVENATNAPRAAVLRQTAFDGAICRERSSIDWLDDCIDAIREGAVPESDANDGRKHLYGS